MGMRRYGLVACAAQLGIVISAGCDARALDPGIPVEPPHDASPPPAHDASPPQPQPPDGPPPTPVVTPGRDAGHDADDDAGADTSGIPIPIDIDAWIAFDSDGGAGNRDIYVIRADGTGRRRLTTESSTDAQPSFSRDGTKLAFASDRERGVMQIYVMDLATGVATRVTQRTEGAHDPAFSSDGTRVGYRSGISVFTAMLDGTDERQITDGNSCCSGLSFGAPVFTSDGQWTIYDDYNAIYLTTGPTYTRRTIVMPTTGEQSHPTLSPDGSRIIVQSTCLPDAPARSLWTVPATGTTQYSCSGGQRLSAPGADATHASWGPSNAVVWGSVTGGTNYTSPVPSALVIWQDGTLWTLTSGSGDDRNPSWSPSGTTIGDW